MMSLLIGAYTGWAPVVGGFEINMDRYIAVKMQAPYGPGQSYATARVSSDSMSSLELRQGMLPKEVRQHDSTSLPKHTSHFHKDIVESGSGGGIYLDPEGNIAPAFGSTSLSGSGTVHKHSPTVWFYESPSD